MRIRLLATTRRPASSSILVIAPVRLRRVASGLMIEKVRVTAMGSSFETGSGNLRAPLAGGRAGRKEGRLSGSRCRRRASIRHQVDLRQGADSLPRGTEGISMTGQFRGILGRLGLAVLAAFLPTPALAQTAAEADAAAPPPLIPTSTFAARSPFNDVPQLSPDGRRLAFSLTEDDKVWVGVADIDRGVLMRKMPLEEDQYLRWIRWAGNDRLMLSLVVPIASNWVEGRVPRLFVADLATGETHYIGPSRGQ